LGRCSSYVSGDTLSDLEDIRRPHTNDGWWVVSWGKSNATSLFSRFGFLLPDISGIDTVGHSEWNNNDFTCSGSSSNTDLTDHEVHVSELE